MTSGRQPQPSVLRILSGHVVSGHSEDRGERARVALHPDLPPGVTLTAQEKEVWDYLVKYVFTTGAHGPGDGMAFLHCVRLYLRALDADAQTARLGTLVRLDGGRVREAPWVRMSRESWSELRRALSEIGGTPAGRARVQLPASGSGAGSGWGGLGPPRDQSSRTG